ATLSGTRRRVSHSTPGRIAAAKVSARSSRMMMLLTFQSPKAIATTATAAAVALTAVRVTSRPGAVAGAGSTRRRSVFAWTAMRPSFSAGVRRRISEFAEGLRQGCSAAEFAHRIGRLADSGGRRARDRRSVQFSKGGNPMESTLDRVNQMADTQLTKMRWALGLNGVLSIAFGVVILIWPGISLEALTILFGAYAFATGVVGFAGALSGAASQERGWLIFSSLLGIAVGVTVFVWTDMSALALPSVIGPYAIALGVIAIAGAFYLPLDGSDTLLLVL